MKRLAALLLYVVAVGGGWAWHQLEMRDADREVAAANAAAASHRESATAWWRECEAD